MNREIPFQYTFVVNIFNIPFYPIMIKTPCGIGLRTQSAIS